MSLYLLIAAAIFAVNAGVTFASKTVTNQQFLVTLALFLGAWLGTGMPVNLLLMQIGTAAVIFVVGMVLFVKRIIGGGVARAFTMAALWVPGIASFLNFIVAAIIAGVVIGGLIAKAQGKEEIDHYASIAFACCVAIMMADYGKLPAKPKTIAAQTVSLTQGDIPLRGLSEP